MSSVVPSHAVGHDQIGLVRSFHRTVTDRVGALHDEYLARGRPLGASRLLWEIGHGDGDTRRLRARLGLDSGYLSRLLRSLEAEGLVELDDHPGDGRRRIARLTAAGRTEHTELDSASDDLARAVLEPLVETDRTRLVDAMRTVERLITAGLVSIAVEDPDGAAARHCLESYAAELDDRFDTGFDVGAARPVGVDDLRPPDGLLLVARLRETPVGCGALKLVDPAFAEIKRVWVDGSARGLGLGRRLLAALEAEALEHGHHVVRLDTNAALHEAIALYRSTDYVEIERFNDEPYAHHWFEKALG
ncbi:MAG: MarR family winged helix-turn-helix transcriptional regulator [Actinomycetota bacterium]